MTPSSPLLHKFVSLVSVIYLWSFNEHQQQNVHVSFFRYGGVLSW